MRSCLPRRRRRRAPAVQRERGRSGCRSRGDPATPTTSRNAWRPPSPSASRWRRECASWASAHPTRTPTSRGSHLGDADEAAVVEGLAAEGIVVRPGTPLGGPGHIRVSYGTPDENRRFLDALRGPSEAPDAPSRSRRPVSPSPGARLGRHMARVTWLAGWTCEGPLARHRSPSRSARLAGPAPTRASANGERRSPTSRTRRPRLPTGERQPDRLRALPGRPRTRGGGVAMNYGGTGARAPRDLPDHDRGPGGQLRADVLEQQRLVAHRHRRGRVRPGTRRSPTSRRPARLGSAPGARLTLTAKCRGADAGQWRRCLHQHAEPGGQHLLVPPRGRTRRRFETRRRLVRPGLDPSRAGRLDHRVRDLHRPPEAPVQSKRVQLQVSDDEPAVRSAAVRTTRR